MASTQKISRSRRILGGHGEDKSISGARTVMTAFDRMSNSIRQVAKGHPSHKQLLQLFLDQLQAYTDEFGELSLEVEPYAFSIDGQPVLKLDRKQESYIDRLFQAGIRQLVFHPGLTEDELIRFVEVLRTDFTDARLLEDDIVTLLWEVSLQGISYSGFDIVEDSASEEAPREAGDSADRSMVEEATSDPLASAAYGEFLDADAVMTRAMAALPVTSIQLDKPHLADRPIVVPAGDRLLQEHTTRPLAGFVEDTQGRADGVIRFSPEQARALRDQVRAADARAATKFGEVIFCTLQGLPGSVSAQVLRGFSNFALTSLTLASEGHLARALGAMVALGHRPEGKDTYQQVLAEMQKPEMLNTLMKRLDMPQTSHGVLDLIRVIGHDSFPILWECVLTLTNTGARQNLLTLLAAFATDHLPLLIGQVAGGPEAAAVQALSILKKLSPSTIARDLLAGLRHSAPAIRLEVASMVHPVDDPVVRQALRGMVHDAEEQVRLAVMQMLLSVKDAGLEDALLVAIHTPSFTGRSPEEKRRTVSSLGRVATSKGLAALRSLAFDVPAHPVKVDSSIQVAAVRALASLADRDALPGLQKLARKWFGDKELKRAARFAIAVINRRAGTS
ncbi:MAG TPA: HEAT repeat domain-containing protein [Candidatus Tectomicrobia bacterium]